MTNTDKLHPGYLSEDNTPASLSTLSALALVTERLSHSVRTHLSVSIGAVDDMLGGFSLSNQDLGDALNALKQILHTVNCFSDICKTPSYSPKPDSLQEIMSNNKAANFGFDPSLEILSELGSSTERKLLDKDLISRALRCLLRYAQTNRISPSKPTTTGSCFEKKIVKLKLQNESTPTDSSLENLSLEFQHTELNNLLDSKTLNSWSELAINDRRPEALGLFFAEHVFLLHGGKTQITFGLNHSVIFEVRL